MMSTQGDHPPSHPPYGALPGCDSGTRDTEDQCSSPITVPLGPHTDHTALPMGCHSPASHVSPETRDLAASLHEQRGALDHHTVSGCARLRRGVDLKRAAREMWSPAAAYHELELAEADDTTRYYSTWYSDRERMFTTIWDPSGGFTRVNVLVLTCLLGPDIIPWLAAKAAGSILVPPFTPHVHLAQAGIDLIVDGVYNVSTYWVPLRLADMGRVLRRLALGLRLRLPGTDIVELMRSVATHHARLARNGEPLELADAFPDQPWRTRPTTARLARIGDPEFGTIVESIPLMLPRIPTFEISLGLPWDASRDALEPPGVARAALRMASHDPCGQMWEPQGYLADSGRPIRHNTQVHRARSGSPIPAVEASVFSFPLSAHALKQVRRMFQGDARTSWVYPQQVVLEFSDYHGPVVVLAGDYMSPPPSGSTPPRLRHARGYRFH